MMKLFGNAMSKIRMGYLYGWLVFAQALELRNLQKIYEACGSLVLDKKYPGVYVIA